MLWHVLMELICKCFQCWKIRIKFLKLFPNQERTVERNSAGKFMPLFFFGNLFPTRQFVLSIILFTYLETDVSCLPEFNATSSRMLSFSSVLYERKRLLELSFDSFGGLSPGVSNTSTTVGVSRLTQSKSNILREK